MIELNIAWYPNPEGGKEIEKVQIKMGEKYLHAMPKFVSTENQLPLDVYNTLKDTLEKCRKHHHLNDVDIKQQMESTGDRARKILGIPAIGTPS